MKNSYHGSCHCGAVRFEAEIDLTAETSRCNCTMCTKTRLWKSVISPSDFRVVQGGDALTEYQFGKCSIQHLFCQTCGAIPFSRGKFNGQPFIAVNVASLDDATDAELAEAPIVYQDGRNDAWQREPTENRYL